MLLNIAPLKKHRDFRLLFIGQAASFLGTMVSYVAVPYQVYALTHSSFWVGMLSLVQLLPLLIFAMIGGQVADKMDRRKVMLWCEILLCLGTLVLMVNAFVPAPSLLLIFIISGALQAVWGFHRPAMESLIQTLVDVEDYAPVGALKSLVYSGGAIVGPALGGVMIAWGGARAAYGFDVISFAVTIACLFWMRADNRVTEKMAWHPRDLLTNIAEGFAYARSRQELLGTYFVDIAAMLFAYPLALFPEMSNTINGSLPPAQAAGLLFTAMAVGSLITTVFSGWTKHVKRHGRAVIIGACLWGIAMIFVGAYPLLWSALLFLVIAGGCDMISALFRGIIWNETIPNTLRGRMASLEMMSYMTGPLLGNARAGWMAGHMGWQASISWGGALAVAAIVLCAVMMPRFWRYVGYQGQI